MAIKCSRMVKAHDESNKNIVKPCGKKASLYVMASKGKGWSGYFCSKHAVSIIRLRMPLIKKYEQNVIMRPITVWDKQKGKVK